MVVPLVKMTFIQVQHLSLFVILLYQMRSKYVNLKLYKLIDASIFLSSFKICIHPNKLLCVFFVVFY